MFARRSVRRGIQKSLVPLAILALQLPASSQDAWQEPVRSSAIDLNDYEEGAGYAPVMVSVLGDADAVPTVAAEGEAVPQPSAAPCACPTCGAAAEKPAPGCKTCCHGQLLDWSKYPATIRPFPRPGMFPIPPKGPGYFSACDHLMGECREAPPKSGYVPFALNGWSFFDADWRYVDAVPYNKRTTVEKFKRLHLNDCLLLSLGGEFWTRYHNEPNSRLRRVNNDYTLAHVRQYADFWYGDSIRLYGEYIWADSFGEELAPLPTEVDRGDILNLFVDVNLFDVGGKPVYVRGGRQELVYGSQRLISPLPWGNRRNTFDGVKVFRQGEKWDFDAFWTNFVPVQPSEFDSADNNLTLAGTWLTYKPQKGIVNDLYYVLYDNDNFSAPLGFVKNPTETHTIGSRWAGDKDGFLWDFEGAMQFGDQGDRDLLAGMGTAGLGRRFANNRLAPTFWMYYDYASGDNDLSSGDAHTFNQIIPFGHYYMGWMDLVGRQNIHDVNAHFYIYPAPWITTWVQYHRFWLDEERDALYNAGGAPYRIDPTGAAGTDVGDEVDLVMNFHLSRYSDILVSYNKLFGGRFLEDTAGPNAAVNAEALYLIFQQRW